MIILASLVAPQANLMYGWMISLQSTKDMWERGSPQIYFMLASAVLFTCTLFRYFYPAWPTYRLCRDVWDWFCFSQVVLEGGEDSSITERLAWWNVMALWGRWDSPIWAALRHVYLYGATEGNWGMASYAANAVIPLKSCPMCKLQVNIKKKKKWLTSPVCWVLPCINWSLLNLTYWIRNRSCFLDKKKGKIIPMCSSPKCIRLIDEGKKAKSVS